MGRHSTAIIPEAPGRQQSLSPPSSRKRKRDDGPINEIEVDLTAPEPPSRKSLRKEKKKSAFQNEKSQELQEGTKENAQKMKDSGPDDTSMRSKYGIWIGNLSWATNKAELREFFVRNMNIEDSAITRIHMPAPEKISDKPPAKGNKLHNKGFAYVNFATEQMFGKALELTEKLFSGRKVLIKDARSFEGRPEATEDGLAGAIAAGKPPSQRIFVGNLDFETTTEELKKHFENCGQITGTHMATFQDSGKCKGYAWIEFNEKSAAEAAVRGWTERGKPSRLEEGEQADSKKTATEDILKPFKYQNPRKWWVNRFRGRSLKIEFAESKDVRYKKRFGKGSGTSEGKESEGLVNDTTTTAPSRMDEPNRPTESSSSVQGRRKDDARKIKPGAALAAAPRLTGSIVQSQGNKITFT